jgi:allophanate hydrolase subunit 2
MAGDAIEVKAPGLATTVQDLGRPGYYHLGIPLSGAMDRFALAAANLLVGNEAGRRGSRRCSWARARRSGRDAVVAVCGAELPAKLDGEPVPGWTSVAVRRGRRSPSTTCGAARGPT